MHSRTMLVVWRGADIASFNSSFLFGARRDSDITLMIFDFLMLSQSENPLSGKYSEGGKRKRNPYQLYRMQIAHTLNVDHF